MKIRLLSTQTSTEEYELIGLSTSLRDYQLCHYLNKQFQTQFVKCPDIPLYGLKGQLGPFTFYHYFDDDLRMDYFLFANKAGADVAISNYKHFEYFILFKLSFSLFPTQEILKELRSIAQIQAAIKVPVQGIKNFDNILEDLELHLLEISGNTQKKEPSQWLWNI